jgi:hypothetical protein
VNQRVGVDIRSLYFLVHGQPQSQPPRQGEDDA